MRFIVWLLAFQMSMPSYASEYEFSTVSREAKVYLQDRANELRKEGHEQEARILEKTTAQTEKDILEGRLQKNNEKAINIAIMIGAGELRRRGYGYEGDRLETEWFDTYVHDYRAFALGQDMRPIGPPHKPLSQWLAEKYKMLELVLGKPTCEKLHLTALWIFNYTPGVVFRPCSFDMSGIAQDRKDEFRDNFAHDYVNNYYGLVPETVWLITYATVTGFTFGTGYLFLAGFVADAAEKAIDLAAPFLSDRVFDRACSNPRAFGHI